MSTHDDVAEFAALLTRLKGRTDRSYGALARRLDMNTSTLHRYCSGDAVPLDFAPVERFAALCGASPEERVELHRRWILAVAARQRTRTAAEAGAPAGPDAPAESRTPESRASESQVSESHTSDVPAADVRDAPVEDAAPDPRPRPPAPSARPWYRGRRMTVAAAVVGTLLAALGTLGSLSALSDGRSSAADASPAPVESSPAPITWTANSQAWQLGCDHDYLIAKSPEQVPPPPVEQDAAPWAATQRAVHGGDTNVEISVQGRSSTPVVLEALRVRVAGRAAQAEGAVYAMDLGCGGAITPRSFAVDLDKDRPVARPLAGNDTGTPIPAVRFPYRVSARNPEVLLVTARTKACDCRWYLELDWSSEGRTGTVRVDDSGRPFRTSGIEGLPHYEYLTREWVARTD